MNTINKTFLSLFLSIFLVGQACAKWATKKDAPTMSSYIQNISVNKDGTYESIKEMKKVILTEVGRNLATNFILTYNGDSEKIDIIEAKTIYKGKEFKVDKKLIEDKPLASAHEGFDQTRQIMIAFPNIELGAEIYLKAKFILKEPPLKNFFAQTFYFGNGDLVKSSIINIKSKIPLYTKINDPEKILKVNKDKDSRNITIKLKKPIYREVANEPRPITVHDKYFTWVSVSSEKSWKEFAGKYAKLVAKVFKQELPKPFKNILKKAKKKKTTVEKINTVTSMLNEKIRYLGDWRTVKGRLVPRNLDEISKTQIGDCKDFSASTAAILTKLGLKAQVAIVLRGTSLLTPNILPGFGAFNHAMVKVTDKDGKVYWIDPTNFSSMAQGIFPDIAEKDALIADEKDPSFEKIPPVDFNQAQERVTRTLNILKNDKILEAGNLLLKNEIAMKLTGISLKVSPDTIKDALFNSLAGGTVEERHKKSMKLPKLKSRIVKDISIDYSFEKENDILQTNVGPALKLDSSWYLYRIYNTSEINVSEALVREHPATSITETTIKNIRAKNIESLNQEKKTPWVYVKRECKYDKNNNIKITDTLIFYKKFIPREDFKKKEFIEFKNWLKRNFKDVIIVFERNIKN